MITHVNLSNKVEHQIPKFAYDEGTAFYCCNGEELLNKTTAHTIIYGHSHTQYYYNYKNIDFYLNALGYPGETARKLTIDIGVKHEKTKELKGN